MFLSAHGRSQSTFRFLSVRGGAAPSASQGDGTFQLLFSRPGVFHLELWGQIDLTDLFSLQRREVRLTEFTGLAQGRSVGCWQSKPTESVCILPATCLSATWVPDGCAIDYQLQTKPLSLRLCSVLSKYHLKLSCSSYIKPESLCRVGS